MVKIEHLLLAGGAVVGGVILLGGDGGLKQLGIEMPDIKIPGLPAMEFDFSGLIPDVGGMVEGVTNTFKETLTSIITLPGKVVTETITVIKEAAEEAYDEYIVKPAVGVAKRAATTTLDIAGAGTTSSPLEGGFNLFRDILIDPRGTLQNALEVFASAPSWIDKELARGIRERAESVKAPATYAVDKIRSYAQTLEPGR